jgi:hypothetical protein
VGITAGYRLHGTDAYEVEEEEQCYVAVDILFQQIIRLTRTATDLLIRLQILSATDVPEVRQMLRAHRFIADYKQNSFAYNSALE